MTKPTPEPRMPAMQYALALILTLALCLGGCVTKKIDWNARVGAYHYDQVVREMGPPDKETTLSDGIKIAEWLTHRGSTRTTFLGDPYYGSTTSSYSRVGPDRFLRMTFSQEGTLTESKRVYR
jgi:hypothetical protein